MCTFLGLSNNGRRCSTAIPDGPGVAPFRADLTFLANIPSSNSNATGFMFRRWSEMGSRGPVRGASLTASNATRPADSSQSWTKA